MEYVLKFQELLHIRRAEVHWRHGHRHQEASQRLLYQQRDNERTDYYLKAQEISGHHLYQQEYQREDTHEPEEEIPELRKHTEVRLNR